MSKRKMIVLIVMLAVTFLLAAYFIKDSSLSGKDGEDGGLGFLNGGKIKKSNKLDTATANQVYRRLNKSVIIGEYGMIRYVNTKLPSDILVLNALGGEGAEIAKQIAGEWEADAKKLAAKKKKAKELAVSYGYGAGPAYYLLIMEEMVARGYIDAKVKDMIQDAAIAQWGGLGNTPAQWLKKYMEYRK